MKFRILDKKTQSYIEDGEFYLDKNGFVIFEDILARELYFPFQEDLVVQFSTGLFDVDGIEIYEGDFLSWEDIQGDGTRYSREAKVVWSPKIAAFVLDLYGRHLFDDKYGDFLLLNKDRKSKIVKNK